MAHPQLSTVMRHLRRIAGGTAGRTDRQLLEDFADRGAEAAFTELVERHGRLVLSVCRRILHHEHDAEDAFQATFLVLARKAGSIRWQESVSRWLHAVAYRVAHKARASLQRRRWHERRAGELARTQETPDLTWRELRPVLDEELHRLPEKYQAPLLLCCLEGKSRDEAAQLLGWSAGTVKGRLERGRELLRRRLARRGIALSAALFATVGLHQAGAAVPVPLLVSTITAATAVAAGQAAAVVVSAQVAALTEGVLQAMFLTKMKIVAVVLLVLGVAGAGTGLLTRPALADKPGPAPGAKEKPAKESKSEAAREVSGVVRALDAAKGTITVGNKQSEQTFAVARDVRVLLDDGTGDRFGFREGKFADLTEGASVTLRLANDPPTVTAIWAEGPTVQGILKAADGTKNTLTLSVPSGSKGEPEEDKTFSVAKSVRIMVDAGKKEKGAASDKTLADLPAGCLVTLKLSADQKSAGSLRVEGRTLFGTIKAVDAGQQTLTLADKQGEQTYKVSPEALVSVDSGKADKSSFQPSKLADVPVGAQATLKLSLDNGTVVAVHAQGLSVHGILKSVDAAKPSVTVSVGVNKGDPPVDQTYDIGKDVRITLDDGSESKASYHTGTLAELVPGVTVSLKLSADQKTVGSLHAEGRGIYGVVKAVDAGRSTITVGDKQGEQTYEVAKEARIVIDDSKPAKLADVPVDAQVSLKLSADQKTAGSIRAEGPGVHGTVKSVDMGKNSLTVAVPISKTETEDRTYAVSKSAWLALGGKGGQPADLREGAEVNLRLSVDQKTVLGIAVTGKEK